MSDKNESSGPEIRKLPRPVDIETALEEALVRLEPIDGAQALIGGVAMAFHGFERYTKDIDLAVALSKSSAATTELADLDPRPLKIGGVSILTSTGVRVDLIDRRLEFQALFEEALASATNGQVAEVGGRTVPVVSRSYLIAMKMVSARPQDEVDIRELLKQPDLKYQETRAIVQKHLGAFGARWLDRLARTLGRSDPPADYENGDSVS